MKKYLATVIMLMSAGAACAQVEVLANGTVNINDPSTTPAIVNIEGIYMNLKGTRNSTVLSPSSLGPVLEGQNNSNGSGWATGIRGVSFAHEGAYDCGVYGLATEGGVYKNFGVIGGLYSSGVKGAGIFGTKGWHDLTINTFSKGYAGYFDGDVHVQGNLTCSGTITGGVLLSSAPPSGDANFGQRSDTSSDALSTASNLSGLKLLTYHHPVPEKTESRKLTDEDFTGEDFAGMDLQQIEAIKKNLMEAEESEDIMGNQVLTKQHYGLDAEQLSEVYPDLVYENEDGTKSINYVEMVPLLVQSINELSKELAEIKGTSAKKAKSQTTTIEDTVEDIDQVRMDQNKPNPFSESTVIKLNIPKDTKTATILIYDLSGKQVKSIPVTERGKTDITVYASDLTAGMYIYSLVVDGQVKVSRRMMVSEV
ncbi:MAG: T9SS type A sorting domain-containing protein [Bacteroidaceae bacterium]|nr:T9SS type A sorting domain-containing protein [Bacteroidaceae bacterium]